MNRIWLDFEISSFEVKACDIGGGLQYPRKRNNQSL